MKLSEAMRLGATLRPQGFGRFIDRDGHTCAMGAALHAVGQLSRLQAVDVNTFDYPEEWTRWWERICVLQCPACSQVIHSGVEQVIGHLNDDHAWTREAIADWVATIEPQTTETTSVEAREAVPV